MTSKLESSNIKTLLNLLILAGVLVYVGWLGRDYLEQQQGNTKVLATVDCQPEQANCIYSNKQQQIRLLFGTGEETVKSGQPIKALVRIEGEGIKASQISFQGRDMYMGENHFPLSETSPGVYETEVQLPVCTTGRMTWQAKVQLNTDGQAKGLTFQFDSE